MLSERAAPSDPYYMAQSEVASLVQNVEKLFREWQDMCSANPFNMPKSGEELYGRLLREIENTNADVNVLHNSVRVVENNPERFKIHTGEIQNRYEFIRDTESTLSNIRTKLIQSAKGMRNSAVTRKEQLDQANDDFFRSRQQQAEALIEHQDEQLDDLAKCAANLNETAHVINSELEMQQKMLQELDEDVEHTTENMNSVMKKMAAILKTNDTKTLWLIIWLIVILMIMVFLVLYV